MLKKLKVQKVRKPTLKQQVSQLKEEVVSLKDNLTLANQRNSDLSARVRSLQTSNERLLQQQDSLEKKVKAMTLLEHVKVYFKKLDIFAKG